jgi:hypothetical protein
VHDPQNQWDYLQVLFIAFSSAGVPKAIVSDGGGIFYCNQALGITKERIEKRQAWQNYIETHFNILMVGAKILNEPPHTLLRLLSDTSKQET